MELRPDMIEFSEDRKPLKPGVYIGERSIVPQMHHKHITVIPKSEKGLSRKQRKHLREIGPNKEKGYIVSASVDRKLKNYIPGPNFGAGKMTTGINVSKGDLKATQKGKGQKLRRMRNLKPEEIGDGLIKSAETFDKRFPESTKYPALIPNMQGKKKNSNSVVRTILDENGVKMRKDKHAPGSAHKFAEIIPLIEFDKKSKQAPNVFKEDIYDKVDGRKMNDQEKAHRVSRKLAPYASGAMTGAAIGGTITGGHPVGSLAGAGAGAVFNKGARKIAEKEGEERRPMTAIAASSVLPAAAVAAPYVVKKTGVLKIGRKALSKKGDSKVRKGITNKRRGSGEKATLGL